MHEWRSIKPNNISVLHCATCTCSYKLDRISEVKTILKESYSIDIAIESSHVEIGNGSSRSHKF